MARKSIALRIALAGLGLMSLGGCGVVARSLVSQSTGYASPGPTDETRAKAAWAYFRASRNGQTGLVETSAGANFATPFTIGDQIAAAIAANRLRIIDNREFDETISGVLSFLATAPLSNGEMPGRYYSTRDGRLMDPPAAGVDPGWSAVDTGHLLVWLRVLAQRYPAYAPYVVRVVARWQTCRAVDDQGQLRRALPSSAGFVNTPDTGSGYGDYAALGFRAWGEHAISADKANPSDASLSIEGYEFALGSKGPTVSTPYALIGLEFGWKDPLGASLEAARSTEDKLWAVQSARFQRTGNATARSDYRRNSAPYVVLDTVLSDGYPWNTTDTAHKAHPELALISTRAAFALAALHGGDHARRLVDTVGTLYDPGSGWYEGRYETGGAYEWTRTAATNAMVLEATLYREHGALFDARTPIPAASGQGTDCSLPDIADSKDRHGQ